MDHEKELRISFVEKLKPRFDVGEECPCHLVWESPQSLLIGWGDTVMLVKIEERVTAGGGAGGAAGGGAGSDGSQIIRYAEIVGVFRNDYIVCGLAPFGDNVIVLAHLPAALYGGDGGDGGDGGGYDDDGGEGGDGGGGPPRPELRIIDRGT
jgi:hypothetical protein